MKLETEIGLPVLVFRPMSFSLYHNVYKYLAEIMEWRNSEIEKLSLLF